MDRLREKILAVHTGRAKRIHKDGERDGSTGDSYVQWEDTKAQVPSAPGLLNHEVTGQRQSLNSCHLGSNPGSAA